MKRTSILTIALALFLCLSLLVLPVSAAEEVTHSSMILMGTPTLDGKVDDIYKNSWTFITGTTEENAYDGVGTDYYNWDGETWATSYILYDESFIYLCHEVVDGDVTSQGEDRVTEPSGSNAPPFNNPWNRSDNVEVRLNFGGSDFKVGVDCNGYLAWGLPNNKDSLDYSKIEWKTSLTDTGYIIEVRFPITTEVINEGMMKIRVQLNDLLADGSTINAFVQYTPEGATPKTTIPVKLSDVNAEDWTPADEPKEDETTPEETTTPEVTTTPEETTTPEVTTNPEDTTTPEVTTTPDATTTAASDSTDKAEEPAGGLPVGAIIGIVAAVIVVVAVVIVILKKKK